MWWTSPYRPGPYTTLRDSNHPAPRSCRVNRSQEHRRRNVTIRSPSPGYPAIADGQRRDISDVVSGHRVVEILYAGGVVQERPQVISTVVSIAPQQVALVHGLAKLWLNGNLPTRLGDDPEDITRRVAATSAPAADNRTDLPGGQKPARRQAARPLPRDKLGAARSPAMERPQITRSTAKRSAWRSRTSGRRSRPCVPSRHGGAPRRFARRAEPGR
jgi:hypothetical protein